MQEWGTAAFERLEIDGFIIFLEVLGRGEAFPLCAAGDEEAGRKDGPGPWPGVKQGAGGMRLGVWCDGGVAVGNGLQSHAALGDEGLHQQGVGGDDAVIGRQGEGTLARLEAGGHAFGSADMRGPAAGLQGGAARAWRRFASGPAAQEVAKTHRFFVRKPLEDVGEGVFEGTGQALRQPACVADEAPTVCDALCQGTPHCAVRGERGELVPVLEQELDLECGIGRVVLRPAGGQRFAVCGHGERMDGKEPEEIIWTQRRHDGPRCTWH